MTPLKIIMENKKLNDDELYSDKTSDDADIYSEKVSLDKKNPPPTRKKNFIADMSDDDFYSEKTSAESSRPKVFHSRKFVDSETQAEEDKKKSSPHEAEIKTKLSHAETSGIAISAVMLAYSLAEGDKPLFFLSTSLLIFLLRPLIGALFGKNNRAVQNALHSFSVVLFIGALIFLFF